jgi:transposase InsO family protein
VGEQDSLKTLERENRELRRANEILKSAAAFLGAELGHRPDDRLHVALVIDAFSRFLVGWQASRCAPDLALDALEMAIWRRQAQLDGLVHHSTGAANICRSATPNGWPRPGR